MLNYVNLNTYMDTFAVVLVPLFVSVMEVFEEVRGNKNQNKIKGGKGPKQEYSDFTLRPCTGERTPHWSPSTNIHLDKYPVSDFRNDRDRTSKCTARSETFCSVLTLVFLRPTLGLRQAPQRTQDVYNPHPHQDGRTELKTENLTKRD